MSQQSGDICHNEQQLCFLLLIRHTRQSDFALGKFDQAISNSPNLSRCSERIDAKNRSKYQAVRDFLVPPREPESNPAIGEIYY